MTYSKQYLDARNAINSNYQRGYVIKASEYNATFNLLANQGNSLNDNIRAMHELLVGDTTGDVTVPRSKATLLEALQEVSDESAQDQVDIQNVRNYLLGSPENPISLDRSKAYVQDLLNTVSLESTDTTAKMNALKDYLLGDPEYPMYLDRAKTHLQELLNEVSLESADNKTNIELNDTDIKNIRTILLGDPENPIAIGRSKSYLQEWLQAVDDESAQNKLDIESNDVEIQAIEDRLIPATDLIEGLMQPEEFNKIYQNETDLETHKTSNDHDGRYYTKTNVGTSGQATVHWDNLTGIPDLADASWKATVALKTDLPLTGNALGDQRKVLDDGDGKMAIYICIATSGAIDEQWDKIADVDWEAGEATRIANEQARETAEGLRDTAETARDNAETSRASAEGFRDDAEVARDDAEGLRVLAENARVSAENARVSAEAQRELDVQTHISDIQASAYHPGNPQPLPTDQGADNFLAGDGQYKTLNLTPYLAKSGGSMTGDINMTDNQIRFNHTIDDMGIYANGGEIVLNTFALPQAGQVKISPWAFSYNNFDVYHEGHKPTPAEIGAEPAHSHPYLPLAGGTMTGMLTTQVLKPDATDTYNIGSALSQYSTIYGKTIYQDGYKVYSSGNKPSPEDIGAEPAHSHPYLPDSGGTLSGSVSIITGSETDSELNLYEADGYGLQLEYEGAPNKAYIRTREAGAIQNSIEIPRAANDLGLKYNGGMIYHENNNPLANNLQMVARNDSNFDANTVIGDFGIHRPGANASNLPGNTYGSLINFNNNDTNQQLYFSHAHDSATDVYYRTDGGSSMNAPWRRFWTEGNLGHPYKATGSTADPNTTTAPLILTNHANNPTGGGSYFYIRTHFYSTVSTTANCTQIATIYNPDKTGVYVRQRYSQVWEPWQKISGGEVLKYTGTMPSSWSATGDMFYADVTFSGMNLTTADKFDIYDTPNTAAKADLMGTAGIFDAVRLNSTQIRLYAKANVNLSTVTCACDVIKGG